MDQRKLVRTERFERKVGDEPYQWTETGTTFFYDNGEQEDVFELGPFLER